MDVLLVHQQERSRLSNTFSKTQDQFLILLSLCACVREIPVRRGFRPAMRGKC